MSRVPALHPIHQSVHLRWLQHGYKLRPIGMDSMPVTNEQREVLERVCLDIFTDMVNAGAPLQEILSAVYMSGVHHTLSMVQDGRIGEARDIRDVPLGGWSD